MADERAAAARPLSCPSTLDDQPSAVAFGVVGGSVAEPAVSYLTAPLPMSDDVRALAAPVTPAEVFRMAGPCAECACGQFEDGHCSIATRLVETTAPAVSRAPRCAIRPSCRWFAEQGVDACVRCPAVVTVNYAPTSGGVAVAGRLGVAAGGG